MSLVPATRESVLAEGIASSKTLNSSMSCKTIGVNSCTDNSLKEDRGSVINALNSSSSKDVVSISLIATTKPPNKNNTFHAVEEVSSKQSVDIFMYSCFGAVIVAAIGIILYVLCLKSQ